MSSLVILLVFIFGTIIGSFLNVVILRYNTGMSLGGRSGCFSCGKELHWYELIPIVSYLFLRGRCAQCKSRISLQYPLVEFSTGFFFAAIWIFFSPNIVEVVYYAIIAAILIVIFVYDLRQTIIPDGMVYTFIVLALLHALYTYGTASFHFPFLWNILAGPILFVPFALLWLLSKGTWMGFGDAKLALGIGFALGLIGGTSAIIFAFWIGAIVSVGYMVLARLWNFITVKNSALFLKGKELTIKSEIPFAPYLIIGFLIVLFFQIDIVSITSWLGM